MRVSTDQQMNSGLSIEAQRNVCLQFIPKGSNVIEFSEGFSSSLKMENRPGLMMALNALEKGDILVIAKRDRIGRDPIVNAMIEKAVEKKKARLISAGGDVTDGSDPHDILMRRMVDAFAEYERLLIGMRTKAALAVKRGRNECVGHIPYGFQLSSDGIHLELSQEEQYNLVLMNQLKYEHKFSFRKIAAEMNSRNRLNRRGIWTHVAISRVMKGVHLRKTLIEMKKDGMMKNE